MTTSSSITTYQNLPVFVLSNFYMYPNTIYPLMVFEERYLALLAHVLKTDKLFAIGQAINQNELDPYMCLVRVVQVETVPNVQQYLVIIEGLSRLKMIKEIDQDDFPFRTVEAQQIENILPSEDDVLLVEDYIDRFKSFLIQFNSEHSEITPLVDALFEQFHKRDDDADFLVDVLSAHFTKNLHVKRQLLMEGKLIERMKLLMGEVEYFLMVQMQKGGNGGN
jgi:Lon protease-like protein